MKANNLRPQSLVFTLYGDYIRHRGRRIWIGSLVRLLGVVGISEPIVRTTVSRMVRRGWLLNERTSGTSFYSLAPAAQSVIEDGARRIFDFSVQNEPWDGSWHLVTYGIPEGQRDARDRFRRELTWLGYGMLTNTVWVSPHSRLRHIADLAEKLRITEHVQLFSSRLEGFLSCEDLVRRCWDLPKINVQYANFVHQYEPLYREYRRHAPVNEASAGECFARRLLLIHEYRRFPYRDPHLPCELLPPGWHGAEAAALFQEYHQALAAPANDYFESVFK